jgi:hypothetical protein
MKLIVRSCLPYASTPWRLILVSVLAALAVVAFLLGWPIVGSAMGLLTAGLLLLEMDRAVSWRCPVCRKKALRTVGTGGLWYEDFREERVFFGQCAACGQQATRTGLPGLSRWRSYSIAQPATHEVRFFICPQCGKMNRACDAPVGGVRGATPVPSCCGAVMQDLDLPLVRIANGLTESERIKWLETGATMQYDGDETEPM